MCGGGAVLQWTSRMILARIGRVVCAVLYVAYGHNNMTEGFKKKKAVEKITSHNRRSSDRLAG